MRPGAMLLVALCLAAPIALAGCFGESSSPIRVVPYLGFTDGQPGRPIDLAFFLESTLAFRQKLDVGIEGLPSGWRYSPEVPNVVIDGRSTRALVVTITPAPDARVDLYEMTVKVGETRAVVRVNVEPLAEPIAASAVADVFVVAWREDGALVWANHPSLRNATFPGAVLANASLEPWRVTLGGAEAQNATAAPAWLAARLLDAGDGRGLVQGETRLVNLTAEDVALLPKSLGGEAEPAPARALVRLESATPSS